MRWESPNSEKNVGVSFLGVGKKSERARTHRSESPFSWPIKADFRPLHWFSKFGRGPTKTSPCTCTPTAVQYCGERRSDGRPQHPTNFNSSSPVLLGCREKGALALRSAKSGAEFAITRLGGARSRPVRSYVAPFAKGLGVRQPKRQNKGTMLETIIIFAACAMLGWNVHVIRKSGVSVAGRAAVEPRAGERMCFARYCCTCVSLPGSRGMTKVNRCQPRRGGPLLLVSGSLYLLPVVPLVPV